jgi:cytochrome d ubiquinol oxidase subunit I
MDDALAVHRLHFAFTATFHYLFAQLSMGIAPLIFLLKTRALRTGDAHYDRSARFWIKILAVTFVLGVVTGIPLEFQFGTNWAEFSRSTGGVIGQTLAMEGMFSFFLESAFLGMLVFGERRLGPRGHWLASLLVFAGSWLSGAFIIVTDAWMQHPVGHRVGAGGEILLESLPALLANPWAFWQYLHNMAGALITGSFTFAGVGAYYLLEGRHGRHGETFVRLGVAAGVVAALLQVYPLGDRHARMVADRQPATFAAMEGIFRSEQGAPLVLVGQPDVVSQRLDNPIYIPRVLSFLTWREWGAEIMGLDQIAREEWPDNIALIYYSYHIMVGLGTFFAVILAAAALMLWRRRLMTSRPMLWILMLSLPFPFIANTAGWITAEAGRQPWIVYGLLRTATGSSRNVSSGNALFTLIGFAGLYTVLGILFLFLTRREIEHGPEADPAAPAAPAGRS